MKTTIEVGGFEIKIEELEGKVTVVAEQGGEVIEEFELETSGEELSGEEGEDIMPFGDEEEDFGGEEAGEESEEGEEFGDDEEGDDEEGEEFGEEEEEEEESKLESFNSFIKKRKK